MSSPKNNYRNSRQDEDIKDIRKHLTVLNDEVGGVKVDVGGIKATQKIILAFIMLILTSIVGLFLK